MRGRARMARTTTPRSARSARRSARAGAAGPAEKRDGVPMIATRERGDRVRRRRGARRQPCRRAVGDAAAARGAREGAGAAVPGPAGRRELRCVRGLALARAVLARRRRPGAPPDALFLGGQNWGLPPLSPVRAAPRSLSLLHPVRAPSHERGGDAAHRSRDGAVPAVLRARRGGRRPTACTCAIACEELLAILTLESNRARCAIAGEDLGTVPEQVRPAMARHGLYRLHVGQWFFPMEQGGRPQPSPAESVASLNTHDTPTFAGWWRGADIDDKRDLGLVDARAGARGARRARAAEDRAARVRGREGRRRSADRGRAHDGRGRPRISRRARRRSCWSRSTISCSIRCRTTCRAPCTSGRTGSAASRAGRSRSIRSAGRRRRWPRSRVSWRRGNEGARAAARRRHGVRG